MEAAGSRERAGAPAVQVLSRRSGCVPAEPCLPLRQGDGACVRAAALSLYCCAPLSMIGSAVVFAVGGVAASRVPNRDWDLALYAVAVGVFIILLVIVLFDVQRVIRWMLRETGSALAVNVKLCVFWCLSVFFSLVMFPAAAAYVAILYYSLRA